jgi:hypothetical protein
MGIVMNRTVSRVASLLAGLSLMANGAWAGSTCAAPQDVTALKTADLQQFLMVAALTCNKVPAYNGFVTSHQGELQKSDKVLLSYFMGRNAQTGDADYNAYKTALANAASLKSLHDPAFCQGAEAAYAAALDHTKLVAQLVSEQPPPIKLVYTSCVREDIQPAESGPQLAAALDLR